MKLGKKIIAAKKVEPVIGDDLIKAQSWSVNKIDNVYIFEYISGELSGSVKKHEITKNDFDELCSGDLSDYDLMLKYNLS